MPCLYETWTFAEPKTDLARAIRNLTGFGGLAADVLSERAGPDPAAAEKWINPRLDEIVDPDELTHCREGAARIADAIGNNRRIGVFTDYDVDGISSAALLSRIIEDLGGHCDTFVPDRMEEGYGLSRAALERAFTEKTPPDLLVVLDCGTRSEKELAWVSSRGIPTLVVDHHARGDVPLLPDDCLLINPHLPDRVQDSFRNHCTAGLVFKLVHSLVRILEDRSGDARERVDLREFLDLVALGTVADLVPILGENRIFVRHGLRQLGRTTNHGLRALLQVADVDTSSPLSPTDIGFRLGPRINAGGRIETGLLGIDLLRTADNRLAFDLARKLDAVNRERQSIERKVCDEALERIGDAPPPGIVVGDEGWHPGVVGIVAGRLSRKFHRPAIVLGWDGAGWKGSGRGIAGLDLLAVMERCAVRPPKWGGHPMAMGLSLGPGDLTPFAEAFSAAVHAACGGVLPGKTLRIDTSTTCESIDRQTVLELESIGPFGQGNPEPVIAVANARLDSAPVPMGRDHIRFRLEANPALGIVGWRMAGSPPPTGRPLDLALRLSRSWWRGRESLRGELVDWRPAGRTPH